MIDRAFLARIRMEPLDRNRHDRAAFSCGEPRIDNYLKNNAARQQDADYTRVRVACIDQETTVVGFHALNAHAIDVRTLPDAIRKKLPSYDTVPAIYLSVVGVQSEYQKKGLGSFLMADALRSCASAADHIGAHFVVLDALNERAAAMYRRLNFVDLPGHEPRMLLNMAQIRKALSGS